MKTYVEERTGTTQVRGADSRVSFDLPLVLGRLQFEERANIGLPSVLVISQGVSSGGEFIVGKRP